MYFYEAASGDLTFSYAPREVLDFRIGVQPAGSGRDLEVSFRERLWSNLDEAAP